MDIDIGVCGRFRGATDWGPKRFFLTKIQKVCDLIAVFVWMDLVRVFFTYLLLSMSGSPP